MNTQQYKETFQQQVANFKPYQEKLQTAAGQFEKKAQEFFKEAKKGFTQQFEHARKFVKEFRESEEETAKEPEKEAETKTLEQ